MHFGAEYPFIIGEYVPGGSIGSRIDAGDWPDEKEALAATIGALDGLAAIHAREIVHRDIKPGNVALRGSDWTDPVILDLGLVRDLLGTSITVYPNLLGTIEFMAPEQLRRERTVRRSDVFRCGDVVRPPHPTPPVLRSGRADRRDRGTRGAHTRRGLAEMG
jgi:serine/threonine protein kinase